MDSGGSIRDDVFLPADDSRAVVLASISGEVLGIDAPHVKEIVGLTPIVSVPRSPEFVLGIFQLRESVELVIDISSALQLPDQVNNPTRILLVEAGRCRTGIAIDHVVEVAEIGVRRFRSENLQSDRPFVKEEVEHRDTWLPVLEFEAMLASLLGSDLVGG